MEFKHSPEDQTEQVEQNQSDEHFTDDLPEVDLGDLILRLKIQIDACIGR